MVESCRCPPVTKIAELLDRDLSKPIKDVVSVNRHDAVTVFAELTNTSPPIISGLSMNTCSP